VKRLAFIILWIVVIGVMSTFVFGLIAGVVMGVATYFERIDQERFKAAVGTLWMIVGITAPFIALVFGILGKLPRTGPACEPRKVTSIPARSNSV
jgi:membrane-anchored glycerophosphoryl diester phosphodiesterase (GDPDase)